MEDGIDADEVAVGIAVGAAVAAADEVITSTDDNATPFVVDGTAAESDAMDGAPLPVAAYPPLSSKSPSTR